MQRLFIQKVLKLYPELSLWLQPDLPVVQKEDPCGTQIKLDGTIIEVLIKLYFSSTDHEHQLI